MIMQIVEDYQKWFSEYIDCRVCGLSKERHNFLPNQFLFYLLRLGVRSNRRAAA